MAALIVLALGGLALAAFTSYESYSSLYDAVFVGSDVCGRCHTVIYDDWKHSPHALMVRRAAETSVVGDFKNAEWFLPDSDRKTEFDKLPAARMFRSGSDFVMSLRRPDSDRFDDFRIDYVVGFQYRQVYLTAEKGGVLRRLPLQWSQKRQEFFPYWNFQEGSSPSTADFREQMHSLNSAWNLFCARCHTTNLEVERKDPAHTVADVSWTETGIACEACHGPGSHHASYFSRNYVNRIVALVNSKVRGEPVAYIASAKKLTKGEDLSVCARCHGPDIMMASTDVYRIYEPGYSQKGRINDLSPHFKEFPLQPGRTAPTVECWDDGRPKGIGMLFRSFIESACYDKAEPRCYDCHNVHNNKKAAVPGILQASAASNEYCLNCHGDLENLVEEHTHHPAGTSGSFCYDCHMPRNILSIVDGTVSFKRTHTMSSIPDPVLSRQFGLSGSPNACNECHMEENVEWSQGWFERWWKTEKADAGESGSVTVKSDLNK